MNPLTLAFFKSLIDNPVTGMMGDAAQGGMQQLGKMMGPQPAQAQQPAPIPQSVPQSQPQSTMGNKVGDFAQQKGQDQVRQRDMRNNALGRIGVPLISAIIGTASDKALPAAAGMATGYNEGYNRQEDLNRKKKIKVFDEETGKFLDEELVIGAFDDVIRRGRENKQLSSEELLASYMNAIGGGAPTKQVGDSIDSTNQKISDISEEDIKYTMEKHGLSREEVLKRLNAQ